MTLNLVWRSEKWRNQNLIHSRMCILESTLDLPSSLLSAFHKKENWLSHRKSRKIKIALINFTFAAQRRWKAWFWLMSSGVMVTQCWMGCRMSLQGWERMCFSRLYFSKHISQKLLCLLFLQLKTELIPTELKPQLHILKPSKWRRLM